MVLGYKLLLTVSGGTVCVVAAIRQSQSCMSWLLFGNNLISWPDFLASWRSDLWGSNVFISAKYRNLIGRTTCMLSMPIIIIVKCAQFCMHCIYRKTFRPAYAQLGILGAMFPKVPVVALTATATEKTRSLISSSLGMVDPVIIAVNPNRQNIFYSCSPRPHTGDDKIEVLLLPYIAKLKVMREKMPLTVMYSSLQVCGECFSVFDRYLGEEQYTPLGSPHFAKNRLFAQFHAHYPEKEKNDILDDLLKGPGKIRVLFVTIAFGIGVDCPSIREILHIGVPNTMEEYFQESGRAGRDGKPALSKVLYNSYDVSKAQKNFQPVMRKFVSTDNCRRRVILEYFGFSIPDSDKNELLHSCCDNCALTCDCNDCQQKSNN